MFTQLGLAVAVVATTSLLAIEPADAQGRKGFRNGGERTEAVNGRRRRSQTNTVIVRRDAPRRLRGPRRFAGRWIGPPVRRVLPRRFRRRLILRNRFFGHRCVAVARRRGGRGRPIHLTRSKAFGPRACRKAMRRCLRKLSFRHAVGRNPYAACIVARRG